MKSSILYLLFVSMMFISVSCELDSHHSRTLEIDYRAQSAEAIGIADEVPASDNWIMRAFIDTKVSWKDVDNWYLNELPKYANSPEYANLKSLAISCLVIAKKPFLQASGKEKCLFYAKEIIYDDQVLNNIEVVAKLLESAKGSSFSDNEIAKHAFFAHKKYTERYKDEINTYKNQYDEAFKTIKLLQHDRWGKPLYIE